MWTCPECGNENDEDSGGCCACSANRDAITDTELAHVTRAGKGWLHWQTVGVPRRFGLNRLLALIFVFALLFGTLRWAGIGPIGFAAITLFILGIGASQAILFDGKWPRTASIVSGAILAPAIGITAQLVSVRVYPASADHVMVFILVGLFLFGGPFGYVFGGLLAGIFLVRGRDLDEDSSTAISWQSEGDDAAPIQGDNRDGHAVAEFLSGSDRGD